MTVDRAWVERNLGFDPLVVPLPERAVSFKPAARASAKPEDFQREIIDFDSEAAEGVAFTAFSKATTLSRFTDIQWPEGLAPKTATDVNNDGSGPLPTADILVVTWTVDEGHALSRVLTPGKDSQRDYIHYTHNFAAISAHMRAGCPALEEGRLGTFWMTSIGGKSVLVFKSDSHMSQDGPELPNRTVWQQIIEEVKPRLVITTGTGGGIGPTCEVGDVIASPMVRFDCTKKFSSETFAHSDYSSQPARNAYFSAASSLFKFNAAQLPPENARAPHRLHRLRIAPAHVSCAQR